MMLSGTTLPEIRNWLHERLAGCQVEVQINGSPCAQNSLLIDRGHGLAAALLLREELGFDFCSNLTAVDWLEREQIEKVKTKQIVDGIEKEVEETRKTKLSGYFEVVYHLFSMCKKEGPLVMRMRTGNRDTEVTIPSLTSVWRSAEFQEREAFDLFGIQFAGHPDLRRLLMWEGYTDHPMRRDYAPPSDDIEEEA